MNLAILFRHSTNNDQSIETATLLSTFNSQLAKF